MIIENDKIAGVPVFCTNYINNDGGIHVGLGVWSYQALGQFGEQRFIVDPYTKASKDTTVLTLNGDWSMTTLRKEAFLLGDCTAAGLEDKRISITGKGGYFGSAALYPEKDLL